MMRTLCAVAAAALLFACQQPLSDAKTATRTTAEVGESFAKAQVTGLTSSLNSTTNEITLSWTPMSGADTYEVLRDLEDLGWETLKVNLTTPTTTLALPKKTHGQGYSEGYTAIYYVSHRAKAVQGIYASRESDTINESIEISGKMTDVSAGTPWVISDLGSGKYSAQVHWINTSNVTLHDCEFDLMFSSQADGSGALSTSIVAVAGTQSVGEEVNVVTTPKVLGFVPLSVKITGFRYNVN